MLHILQFYLRVFFILSADNAHGYIAEALYGQNDYILFWNKNYIFLNIIYLHNRGFSLNYYLLSSNVIDETPNANSIFFPSHVIKEPLDENERGE